MPIFFDNDRILKINFYQNYNYISFNRFRGIVTH